MCMGVLFGFMYRHFESRGLLVERPVGPDLTVAGRLKAVPMAMGMVPRMADLAVRENGGTSEP